MRDSARLRVYSMPPMGPELRRVRPQSRAPFKIIMIQNTAHKAWPVKRPLAFRFSG